MLNSGSTKISRLSHNNSRHRINDQAYSSIAPFEYQNEKSYSAYNNAANSKYLKPKIVTKSQLHHQHHIDQCFDKYTQQTDDKIDTDCQSCGDEHCEQPNEIKTPLRERFFSADHAEDAGLIDSTEYPVKISSCANKACHDGGDT